MDAARQQPAHRPARLRRVAGAACGVVLLGAAGCATSPGLAAGPGQELAAGAERLADHLEAGAGCEAREQAETLLARARTGEEAGEVPTDVVGRIEDVTGRVDSEVSCEPDPEPTTDTDEVDDGQPATADDGRGTAGEGHDEQRKDNADKDNGKDNGKGNGKGNGDKGNNGKGKG